MHTQFGIAHASALDARNSRCDGYTASERIASLAKFTAMALAFAAGIYAMAAISKLPPGSAVFHAAEGQKATAIGLDALGSRTDFFSVGKDGLEVEVAAPAGQSFKFASGRLGASAHVKLLVNTRSAVEFDMVDAAGGSSKRVVDFRGWSAPRAMSFDYDELNKELPQGQSWRSHEYRSGKYIHNVVDAASYRYALRPGQSEALLQLPFIPLEEMLPSDVGEDGYAGSYLNGVDFSVKAGRTFKGALTAPPGMSIKAQPAAKPARAYEFVMEPGAKYSWTIELIDGKGASYPVRVSIEASAPAPAAVKSARAGM